MNYFFEKFVKRVFNKLNKFASYTFAVNFFVFFIGWFNIVYGAFLTICFFYFFHLKFIVNNIHLFTIFIFSGIIVTVLHSVRGGLLYKSSFKKFYKKFNSINKNFISIEGDLKNSDYDIDELHKMRDELDELSFQIRKDITLYTLLFFFITIISLSFLIDDIYMLFNYAKAIGISLVIPLLLYRFSGFLMGTYLTSFARVNIYRKIYIVDRSIKYPERKTNIFSVIVYFTIFLIIDFLVIWFSYLNHIFMKNHTIFIYLIFIILYKSYLFSFIFIWLRRSFQNISKIANAIVESEATVNNVKLFPLFIDNYFFSIQKKLNAAFTELVETRQNFKEKLWEKTKEVVQLKNLLREIIETLPVGVVYVNGNNIIEVINNKMTKIFGMESWNTSVGKNIFENIPEEISKNIRTQTGVVKFGNRDTILFHGGYYKLIRKNIHSGFILVAIDVTNERVMLEEINTTNTILQEKIIEAQKASQAKSIFLANMSHEIRTPLNSIVGFVDILLADKSIDKSVKEKLRYIESSSFSLLQLISDILDIAKIESGKLEVNNVNTNFISFVSEISNIIKGYSLFKSKVDIIFDIDETIPIELEFDSLRIKQILMNLLSNAIKFTKQGYILLSIKVVSRNSENISLNFTVEDTGIGIPEEKREKILQPFEQAEKGTTRQYGGTGLGLTLSSKLIEILGGRLIIESEENVGSKFSFTLNFNIVNKERTANTLKKGLKDVKNIRVVFLDDNELNLKIFKEFCDIIGIKKYDLFKNYDEFQDAINKISYDIFFIDINMPGKDGITIVKELKQEERFKDKIFIATSSILDTGYKIYYEAGFNDILLKPILLKDFIEKIGGVTKVKTEKHKEIVDKITKKHIRVLVVEDIKMNQIVIANMLEKLVDTVDLVDNGEKSVNFSMKNKYDLILMDIHMPVMDGYDATKLIREFDKEVKIFALTADAMQDTIDKCLSAGMDGVLTKPVKIQDIKNILENVYSRNIDVSVSQSWIENFRGKLNLSKEDVKDILSEFKTSFEENLKKLHNHIEKKDIKNFEDTSHAMKGMVRTLYHNELTEILTTINNYGKQKKIPKNISTLMGKVKSIWEKVKNEVENYIQ